MQVNKILRSKKLYLHSDYDFVGKTYHGGLIYFELTQYANKHTNLYNLLSKISIEFDKNTVDTGISQLVAEMETSYENNGYENVVTELKKIHEKQWINLDDFGSIDTKSFRRELYPFLAHSVTIKSKKLKLKIIYKEPLCDNERNILPLFRQVSHLIMVNLENAICDTYGYFSLEDSFKAIKNRYELTNVLCIGPVGAIIDKKIVNYAQNLVKSMIRDDVFTRFSSQLRLLSYEKRHEETVNFERNYEDTLIFIGSKGWKSITTLENIDLLLKKSTFEFSSGKQKISAPIIIQTRPK